MIAALLLAAATAVMNPNPLLRSMRCTTFVPIKGSVYGVAHSYFETGLTIPDGPNGGAAAIVAIERVRVHGELVGYLYRTTLGHRFYSDLAHPIRLVRTVPTGATTSPCVSVEDKLKR